MSGLRGPPANRVITNLELLGGLDHLEFTRTVADLAAGADPVLKVLAYGAQLKNGDLSHLDEISLFLEQQPAESNVPLLAIANRIYELKFRPQCLGWIIRLSSSRHTIIRTEAMNALREMKSDQSVPALVARLDDADPYLRFVAVRTLAEITHRTDESYAPALGLFDQDPSKYVSLWKRWWEVEGRSQYSILK